MKTFDDYCRENEIAIYESMQEAFILGNINYARCISETNGIAIGRSISFSNTFLTYQKAICIGKDITDSIERTATKWHELGHLMHVYGGHNAISCGDAVSTLTEELAANLWVYENYEGEYTFKQFIPHLQKCIISYINKCSYATEFEGARKIAQLLNVDDQITWIQP